MEVGEWPRISVMRRAESWRATMKAAGACRRARRRFRPPRETEREAFNQDQSDRGLLQRSARVSLMMSSKERRAGTKRCGGQV